MAQERCAQYSDRVTFIEGNGYDLKNTLKNLKDQAFDMIFLMNNLAFIADKIDPFTMQHLMTGFRHWLTPTGNILVSENKHYIILDKKGKLVDKELRSDFSNPASQRLPHIVANSKLSFWSYLKAKLGKSVSLELDSIYLIAMDSLYDD